MDAELREIISDMTARLAVWLDKPSPAGEKLAAVRKQLDSLKGELGAGLIGDTLKQLKNADAEAQRSRQREAAEAIAELAKEQGVMLDAKEPPKRRRRTEKPEQKPEPTQKAGDGETAGG
jgi:hypothetical protein